MKSSQKGVEWVILITENYSESVSFYKDKLGFKIKRQVPDEDFCQFVLKNCYLAIFSKNQLEKLLPSKYLNKPGGAIYSLPETNAIDADYHELKNKGVTFIKVPTTQTWGQRTAYFTDPDGHIWELQQWL